MNLQRPPNAIEWTRLILKGIQYRGYTWNPLPGCLHECRWIMPDGTEAICYAEAVAEGVASAAYPHGFAHADYFFEKRLQEPLRVTEPSGIFPDSMGDLFGAWHYISDERRAQVLAVLDVMHQTPQHRYLPLTKNPAGYLAFNAQLPDNLWAGISMPPTKMNGHTLTPKLQHRWLARGLEILDQVEAQVRWVSFEPLSFDVVNILRSVATKPLDWCVIGAASDGRRTFQPEHKWVTRLLDYCDMQGTKVFFKGNLDWPTDQWRADFPDESNSWTQEEYA